MAMLIMNGAAVRNPAGVPAFIYRVVSFFENVRVAVARRREIANLASMSDYMLADMGLTRGSVNAALDTPFWQDPSEILANSRVR